MVPLFHLEGRGHRRRGDVAGVGRQRQRDREPHGQRRGARGEQAPPRHPVLRDIPVSHTILLSRFVRGLRDAPSGVPWVVLARFVCGSGRAPRASWWFRSMIDLSVVVLTCLSSVHRRMVLLIMLMFAHRLLV